MCLISAYGVHSFYHLKSFPAPAIEGKSRNYGADPKPDENLVSAVTKIFFTFWNILSLVFYYVTLYDAFIAKVGEKICPSLLKIAEIQNFSFCILGR